MSDESFTREDFLEIVKHVFHNPPSKRKLRTWWNLLIKALNGKDITSEEALDFYENLVRDIYEENLMRKPTIRHEGGVCGLASNLEDN